MIQAPVQPIQWLKTTTKDGPQLQVAYRGPLSGSDLRLQYGFDGWREPIRQAKLERIEPGLAVSEPISGLDGHVSLDCVVTDGRRWDNNSYADYRLWINFDPLDAHMHVSGSGSGPLGATSLRAAMASAGINRGIVSWVDNSAYDGVEWSRTGLFPLVWVRPDDTSPEEVRERLASGYIGLKLHPTVDGFHADTLDLDPYLELAEEHGCPVACHSAPGDADPDYIRRLAERYPNVPVILYHTYLGPLEGRRRAAVHVREQLNLYLETSWCSWREVLRLVEEAGTDRVIFGSDASTDGVHHYCRRPPNVEGKETYNEGLPQLVQALDPESARLLLGDNARRVFGLNGNSHSE